MPDSGDGGSSDQRRTGVDLGQVFFDQLQRLPAEFRIILGDGVGLPCCRPAVVKEEGDVP